METQGFFPVPVYWAQTDNKDVQLSFEKIHQEYTEQGQFKIKEGWNTHKLSDTTFKSNLIEEYNLVKFKEELTIHLGNYLRDVGLDPDHEKFLITASWMTSFSKGEYSHQHCHATADIAGVYYVKASTDDARFYIKAPNKLMSASYVFKLAPDTIYYQPTPGKIILFPGWLDHGVSTQTTDTERVSISFNIVFERRY